MTVDESLAKGLSKRTFRYYAERSSLYSTYIKRNCSRLITRREMEKFRTLARKTFPDVVVNTYIGGSKRYPFLCLSSLLSHSGNINEDWQEDMLYEISGVFGSGKSQVFVDNPAAYSVSRHAAQRYIQRACKSGLDFEQYYSSFLGSMRYIRLWSELWGYLLHNSRRECQDQSELSLMFPAEDGIYLGKQYSQPRVIGIRTFVSRDMLSRQQCMLLDTMLLISRWAIDSPLSFAVVLVHTKFGDVGAITKLGRIAFSRLGADQALLADLTFGQGADRDASGLKSALVDLFGDEKIDGYQELMELGSADWLYQMLVFSRQPGTFLNKQNPS